MLKLSICLVAVHRTVGKVIELTNSPRKGLWPDHLPLHQECDWTDNGWTFPPNIRELRSMGGRYVLECILVDLKLALEKCEVRHYPNWHLQSEWKVPGNILENYLSGILSMNIGCFLESRFFKFHCNDVRRLTRSFTQFSKTSTSQNMNTSPWRSSCVCILLKLFVHV